MSQFVASRFQRVLMNDALRAIRPLGICTLAALVLTTFVYLLSFSEGEPVTGPPVHFILFSIYLGTMGVIYTSMSFNDMHHPLERYTYLMLPCSNLERMLSRYLLTAPLFVLYAVATFLVMDWVGNAITSTWLGTSEPLFSPFSAPSRWIIGSYLLLHVFGMTGAIYFRSYSLIKTVLTILILQLTLAVVAYLSLRIFYPGSFSGWKFEAAATIQPQLLPFFATTWMNVTALVAFALWILFVAYRCLCGHEVQDEL